MVTMLAAGNARSKRDTLATTISAPRIVSQFAGIASKLMLKLVIMGIKSDVRSIAGSRKGTHVIQSMPMINQFAHRLAEIGSKLLSKAVTMAKTLVVEIV